MFTEPAVALPLKKRALRGRRLIAVDLENVAGGAVVTRELADWSRAVIESALDVVAGEQVVIGTSHMGLFNAAAAWPGARLRVRSGPDGADLELLDVLNKEGIEERFDEVALVSGDGIFDAAIARLAGAGVTVTVASWSERLSPRLRIAAGRIVYLDPWADRHDKEAA